MKNLKIIYQIIKKSSRKYIIFLSLLAVFSAISDFAWPFLVKKIIDSVVAVTTSGTSYENGFTAIAGFMLVLLVIFIIQNANDILRNYYQVHLTSNMENDIRVRLFTHLSRLSVDFFENEKIGKTINKIGRGITRGTNLVMDISNWGLVLFIDFIVAIAIFFYLNVYIGLISLIISIFYIYLTRRKSKLLEPMHRKINRRNDELGGRILDVLSNMQTVRLFSKETAESSYVKQENARIVEMYIDRAKKRRWNAFFRYLLSYVLRISIIFITATQALKGTMTAGDIFMVFSFSNYIIWPLGNAGWVYDEAIESMRSVKDIVRMLEIQPSVQDVKRAKNIMISDGDIEFKNVSFGYKKEGNIFKNLSFKIKAGKSVALVGPSGAGKSTITKLVTRLYDPKNGTIYIDGQNIAKVKQSSLREGIGVVLQNTILFNDTIKNNIKYGNERATHKQIEEAAITANIHDFILTLPNRYNTMVGERGVKLSGGEAQRIAIARAVLKNPRIFILDEATSSLDSENEKLIQDALWKLIKNRTTLIIAHRLSTVMRADEIFVIDKGKIVERGNHKELVKKGGLYADLYKIQSGALLLADDKGSKI